MRTLADEVVKYYHIFGKCVLGCTNWEKVNSGLLNGEAKRPFIEKKT